VLDGAAERVRDVGRRPAHDPLPGQTLTGKQEQGPYSETYLNFLAALPIFVINIAYVIIVEKWKINR
jgi:hypothetical protein